MMMMMMMMMMTMMIIMVEMCEYVYMCVYVYGCVRVGGERQRHKAACLCMCVWLCSALLYSALLCSETCGSSGSFSTYGSFGLTVFGVHTTPKATLGVPLKFLQGHSP